jgi:hypothetical protein
MENESSKPDIYRLGMYRDYEKPDDPYWIPGWGYLQHGNGDPWTLEEWKKGYSSNVSEPASGGNKEVTV